MPQVLTSLDCENILRSIKTDSRYLANIEYGKPRRGHAEGTVKAHIEELERNLESIRALDMEMSRAYLAKLLILIHVHDSFKNESGRDLPILDPQSHSSIARAYLAQYTDDEDLLNIVQYHDLGYAIYKKFKSTGRMDTDRLMNGLNQIIDLDLFLLFAIIDACTDSKGREGITWLVREVRKLYPDVWVNEGHILPGGTTDKQVW